MIGDNHHPHLTLLRDDTETQQGFTAMAGGIWWGHRRDATPEGIRVVLQREPEPDDVPWCQFEPDERLWLLALSVVADALFCPPVLVVLAIAAGLLVLR